MKDKVKMGILLTFCLLLCLFIQYLSNYVFDFIIFGISIVATIEFRKLQLKAGYPSFDYCPEIACFLVFVATFTGCICGLPVIWTLAISLLVVVVFYLVVLIVSCAFFTKELENDEFRIACDMTVKKFALFKSNNTLICMIYPTLPLFFAYLINHISNIGFVVFEQNTKGVPMGLFGLVLLFFICCLTDTFAMLFGTLIGGKIILPKVSPKKTISGCCFGLLGGVVGALATYFIFYAFFPNVFIISNWWKIILVGLSGSLLAEVGDFFESYCKRKAGVKDAGNFFRSHGGVLDRLDSVLFCAPLIFVCILFLFG